MRVLCSRTQPVAAAAVLAVALSGPVAVAQGEPPIEPSAFGVGNVGVTTIPLVAFLPTDSDTDYDADPQYAELFSATGGEFCASTR